MSNVMGWDNVNGWWSLNLDVMDISRPISILLWLCLGCPLQGNVKYWYSNVADRWRILFSKLLQHITWSAMLHVYQQFLMESITVHHRQHIVVSIVLNHCHQKHLVRMQEVSHISSRLVPFSLASIVKVTEDPLGVPS